MQHIIAGHLTWNVEWPLWPLWPLWNSNYRVEVILD